MTAAYDQLNERQQRFVDEYLRDPNATEAARKAGYSPRTAYRMGAENLRKPQIRAAIARHREERCERTKVDADWVLHKLTTLAEANILDMLEIQPDGTVKPNLSKLTRERAAAIVELVVVELPDGTRRVKVKLVDKLRALELIGKHTDVRAFVHRIEHETGPGAKSLVERLWEARQEQQKRRRKEAAEKTKRETESTESVTPVETAEDGGEEEKGTA